MDSYVDRPRLKGSVPGLEDLHPVLSLELQDLKGPPPKSQPTPRPARKSSGRADLKSEKATSRRATVFGIKALLHLSSFPVSHWTALPAPGRSGYSGGFQFYFETGVRSSQRHLKLSFKRARGLLNYLAEVEAGPAAATHLHSPIALLSRGLTSARPCLSAPPFLIRPHLRRAVGSASRQAPPGLRLYQASPRPGALRAPPLSGLCRVPPPASRSVPVRPRSKHANCSAPIRPRPALTTPKAPPLLGHVPVPLPPH